MFVLCVNLQPLEGGANGASMIGLPAESVTIFLSKNVWILTRVVTSECYACLKSSKVIE